MIAFALSGLSIGVSAALVRLGQLGRAPLPELTALVHVLAPILLATAMALGFVAQRRSLPRLLAWMTVAVVALPPTLTALELPRLAGPGLKLAYAVIVVAASTAWFLRRVNRTKVSG